MWSVTSAKIKLISGTERPKVKNSSPKNVSVDCWSTVGQLSFTAFYENLLPTVGRQTANSRPTVGSMSVICWPSVGWEPMSNTRKASARREEHCISTRNETFSLESTALFRFFRDQSPRNLLCLGFLGTKPLTIPSHHPRSQEAKNLFTAASCSVFFCFTKSEHYQLIFIIGHWLLKTWWLLKELFLLRVKLHS